MSLEVAALEPWLGGSHERFLRQWQERSAHRVHVVGLPPRRWKWHMKVGPWALGRELARRGLRPDVVFASGLLDVAAMPAFLPPGPRPPIVVYFHESQLTYPERRAQRDLSWAFANLFACLAADRVLFNSRFHLDEMARAADELLARMPRPRPRAALRERLARALVVPPGIDAAAFPRGPGAGAGAPLRVVFNQRWEHDKDPAAVLRALRAARCAGARLELVLLGERFARAPEGTGELLAELAPAIVDHGFVTDRAEYARLLGGCDLVVSAARHEFFGLAVLEALAAGCSPLLPNRLSYPELLPQALWERALYTDERDLAGRLARAARAPQELRAEQARAANAAAAAAFDAARTARELDALVEELARPYE